VADYARAIQISSLAETSDPGWCDPAETDQWLMLPLAASRHQLRRTVPCTQTNGAPHPNKTVLRIQIKADDSGATVKMCFPSCGRVISDSSG
jgi:hypothetical protein